MVAASLSYVIIRLLDDAAERFVWCCDSFSARAKLCEYFAGRSKRRILL